MSRENLNDIIAFLAVAREQLHPSCREARRFAIGAKPRHPRPREAAGSFGS